MPIGTGASLLIGGLISLITAGAQGGMQAGANKKAASRAEEITGEQDRQVDEQRDFARAEGNKDLSRAQDEFAHTKGIQDVNTQFTKMDLGKQQKQVEDIKQEGFTQNILGFGTGSRLREKDRSRFRLGAQ